jgi:E3 ubiquitin-protein ligase HUWE1
MDYEEDVAEDDGEVVSDEDEDADMGPIEGLPGDSGMDIEVVIDDDDDGDDEDDDEDHDHSDMEDDEAFAGEITGDHDNESLDDGEDDEWESEELTEDEEEAEMMNQFQDELADIRHSNRQHEGQRIDDLFRVLNEAAAGVDDLQGDSLGGDIQDEILDDLNEDGGMVAPEYKTDFDC